MAGALAISALERHQLPPLLPRARLVSLVGPCVQQSTGEWACRALVVVFETGPQLRTSDVGDGGGPGRGGAAAPKCKSCPKVRFDL